MKFLKSIVAGLFMTLSVCAYAQSGNSGISSSTDDEYCRYQVGYVISTPKYDGKSEDDSYKGLSLGWIGGSPIKVAMPLYYEIGFNFTWLHYKESEGKSSVKENIVSLAIPINLAYKIEVNDDISIVPYAGLNFKGNLSAKSKETYDGDSETIDYFNKKDVGSDGKWNRFQIGGQVGVGVNIKKIYVGYQFQGDFMELAKKYKMPTNSIVVGFNIK